MIAANPLAEPVPDAPRPKISSSCPMDRSAMGQDGFYHKNTLCCQQNDTQWRFDQN